ncbi:MAG TPA: DUF4058 family protein [Pirellulales bacterium]|nr:DUF4058 family protein [Pirellulales bacterium]
MSSPFPGMDPFLEHPDIFPDLHDRLNTHLSEVLQVGLPSPYYAVIGRRTWIEVSQRYIGPDVQVQRSRGGSPPVEHLSGGVAIAAVKAKVVRVPHDERRETFLEVYVRQGSDKRLVTSIEILSLTNKTPGEHGRELYLRKQREILGSKVHLVEIDLLRGGEHSTAVPCQCVLAEVGPFDYHVCVHHFDNLEDYFVYPIQLDERLPQIAIPLLPGDPAVIIDLQAVLDHCYDAGPYAREVNYQADALVPPLRADKEEWAKGVLQRTRQGRGG